MPTTTTQHQVVTVSMAGTRPLLGTPPKTILNKPPDKFEVLALCTQQC